MSRTDLEALFQGVRDSINVGPPDVDAIVAIGRRARRRRRLLAEVASLGSAALILAGAVWLWPTPTRSGITDHSSTVPTPWVSQGLVHLGARTVRVGAGLSLAQVPDGVVYVTANDRLVWVHSSGRVHTLATGVDPQVASDPQSGLVAWVEGTLDRHQPTLVVYDTTSNATVDTLRLRYKGPRWQRLDEGDVPISIDHGVVYYTAQDGDYRWNPATNGLPTRVTPANIHMLDYRSGVTLTHRWDEPEGYGQVTISRSGVSSHTIAERFAYLSPDGRYALAQQQAGAEAGYVHVYNTQTGQQIATGIPGGFRIDRAAFAEDGHLIVAGTTRPPDVPTGRPGETGIVIVTVSGPLDLLNCDLTSESCTTAGHNIAPGLVLFPGIAPGFA